MGNLLNFPDAARRAAFQRVQATYSVRDISRQFGLGESLIRRWTREGLIPTAPGSSAAAEPCYDFRALKQFRRVRELRSRGVSLQQINRELRGQMRLFPESSGELIPLPIRRSPFEEALLLYDAGNPGAAELFQRAIQEEDCIADCYCNLGIIEFDRGRLPVAFDCFTRSLKEDPRHFESHYNLANLYFEMGDYRLAKQHYEFAGVLEPNFPNLHFNLGLVHALQGDLKAAARSFRIYSELAGEEEAAPAGDFLARLKDALAEQRTPLSTSAP
jgi:tetratricopeptide (TPR) repeat protein